MGILKDKTQLEFYISALERWSTLATHAGTADNIQADLVLAHAFNQAPDLCREMTEHFGGSLKGDSKGVERIIEWLKTKFGLNKHADMVKILNNFLNTSRNRGENLIDFISRFERNYSEVKKMGETFSPTCLSILLLRQSQLSDTDSQIITINLSFDPKAEKAEENFNQCKASMIKFQHSKTANHIAGHTSNQKHSNTAAYLANLENSEEFDADQIDSIKTFLGEISSRGGRGGRGGGRGGRGGGARTGQERRVWKCDFCICTHPRWKDCGCPCVSHKKENCPNPDPKKVEAYKKRKAELNAERDTRRRQDLPGRTDNNTEQGFIAFARNFTNQVTQEETEYELSLITKVTKEIESDEFQPLQNLFEILNNPDCAKSEGVNSRNEYTRAGDPQARVQNSAATTSEDIFLRDDKGQTWRGTVDYKGEIHKLSLLVDCGSPSTIVGVEDFKEIKQQYTAMIQSNFQYRQSNKHYQFGGGRKTYSLGCVRLPIYVFDDQFQPHLLHVWVEVLNQPRLPLLLGGRSLTKVKGTLCFKSFTLSMDWGEKRLVLPIKEEDTGHFHLQFYPMSVQEENLLTRNILDSVEWSLEENQKVVAYIAREEDADITKIRKPEEISKQKKSTPLTRAQIIRLHQALGHASKDKIKDMVKRTKLWNNETLQAIEELANCEICAVEHNRLPRPRVGAPRAVSVNHIVAIDIKENRRYKNAPPYILYLIDVFSRFKAGCFLKNKSGEEVANALVLQWFRWHGAPKYLMSDRGKEFLNGEVRDLCQFHGIRYTTTASHSPHQNGVIERGHAICDRSLERMLSADPALKPEIALSWVLMAANSMQNVDGCVPFQLMFGRVPKHPSLVEENPGQDEVLADSQSQWARHYRIQMAAREAFAASEADKTIRKALRQRIYADISRVQTGDWVYFKRNPDRYWRGPAKVVLKDRKTLHCVMHGNPLVLNLDDVLLHKPDTDEIRVEHLISLPEHHQPPVRQPPGQTEPEVERTPPAPALAQDVPPSEDSTSVPVSHNYDGPGEPDLVLPRDTGPLSKVSQQSNIDQLANSGVFHDKIETLDLTETDDNDATHTAPPPGQQSPASEVPPAAAPEVQPAVPGVQPDDGQGAAPEVRPVPGDPGHNPATSTITAEDLGLPLQCNLCEREISSRNFQEHCVTDHNIVRPNIRVHAKVVEAKQDSIYQNFGKLRPGVVVVDEKGNYLTLVKPTNLGWTVRNVNNKTVSDLELVKHMADMRYVGLLEDQNEEGINVVNVRGQKVFVEFGDYNKKIFFTAPVNYHEEQTFVVNIPRSRHGEPECVAAKMKELKDYENYEVFKIVEESEANNNVISTEWVLVEKEKPDGSKVIKSRLCLRGDLEKSLHQICRESPTVNKMSLKILLTIAVSQGWNIKTCDVERAFLQSDPIQRDVFVKPPPELQLPRGKILKLNKTAYGLVDASRAFYLKQAKEMKEIGFNPTTMDPALFIHKSPGQEMCDAAAAVHVDDSLMAGKQEVINKARQDMSERLNYGSVEELPFRFLGSNYKRGPEGEIILDLQHYVDSLEVPDMRQVANKAKQDVLSVELQSKFRSLASKIHVLATTVRPDFMYAAKYLSTRYGKATKSDLTQITKLIKRAKEETTEVVIPNIGKPEDWILAGVVDASHRTSGNLFAVGGHVIMLINKNTLAASTLHWASKKIERIVHSSAAAETLSMQKMFSTLYFIRRIISDMCGARVENLKCVALTDNQGLFSNIHYLKANSEDFRLHADIIELRQNIEQEKTVQEVRYVHSSLNLADCLTKSTKTGVMLLQVVRTGLYDLPGGTRIRDSTMTSVRTWNELMRIEAQEEETTKAGGEGDKTAQSVLLVSVLTSSGHKTDDKPPANYNNIDKPGGSPSHYLASVSHLYDGPGESDLVLPGDTEALSQVSKPSSPDQLANPDFFHENRRGSSKTLPWTNNTIVQEGRNRDDNTKNFSLAGDNQSQAAAAHWM